MSFKGLQEAIYCEAWQTPFLDRKILCYFPESDYAYEAVLQRALCGYYGLCIKPVVVEPGLPSLNFDYTKQELRFANNTPLQPIEIFDVLGRLIDRKKMGDRLEVSQLPPGSYFARVEGKSSGCRFVVQR